MLFGLYDHQDGVTGDLLCKFVTFGNVAWLSSCASVYTLVVIAWERYNAIINPFQSRNPKRYLKHAIVGGWVAGVLICLPETVALSYMFPK